MDLIRNISNEFKKSLKKIDRKRIFMTNPTKCIKDYEIGQVVGEGAYGHVLYAKDKSDNNRPVVIKVINKKNLLRSKKTQSPINEKESLSRISHPNIVSLFTTFQDHLCLYYVFEYIPNGLLSQFFKKELNKNAISHLFGQLLLAIAHIHQKGIIHRDLKPENVMLDDQNRIKLIDFGSVKLFESEQQKEGFQRGSFVGSVDYISPEVLGDSPTSPSVDLWAFGCMIFTAFEGRTPFYHETKMVTYQNIENGKFELTDKTPEDAADLIKKLLIIDYTKRLGYGEFDTNYSSIRSHPFFQGINWDTLPKEPPPL